MCFWIQRMGFRLRTVLAIPPSSPLSLWERARVRAATDPSLTSVGHGSACVGPIVASEAACL